MRLKTDAEESAERIVRRAHSEGIGVEEYLRRNWDEYEVDGMLGENAQKAIELEKRQRRQYSLSEDAEENAGEGSEENAPENMRDIKHWLRSAFGSLRIVNKGGTPVDVAYENLRTVAPEMFPAKYTHPADQLQRMPEVAKSIHRAEVNYKEYFGHIAEEFKAWAKNDFNDVREELSGRILDLGRTVASNAAAQGVINCGVQSSLAVANSQIAQLMGLTMLKIPQHERMPGLGRCEGCSGDNYANHRRLKPKRGGNSRPKRSEGELL